ncbi:TonB-dependent receptor plug domain-containing protein [Algicola sagamiensis]|uniref:TonB-dependent receptor plug domain-containing protein n=1 Tax=Algicola sagamiensis TaxID=163869 RepID=UPI00036AAA80|nr:TonB-dependent receptor [Algicola sagamiensis]
MKRAPLSVTLPISVSLIAVPFFISAQTEEDLSDYSLEELMNTPVSTASLRNQSAFEAPSKVSVIQQQMIQDRNYRYLSDVLKDLPAVRLSLYAASPDSGSSEMIVRGIRGNNKVVLMWNGQRLNHPDSQPLHITPYLYPLADVDQIEIIYGSSSALYGSDTVSMTINMISSAEKALGDTTWQVAADYGRYSEKKAMMRYMGSFGQIDTSFLFDIYDTDGVDFSGFEQFYSRYPDGPGVDAGFTFFPKGERDPFYNPSERSITAKLRFELDKLAIQTYYQRLQTQTQLGWSPLTYEANGKSGHYIFNQFGFFLTHQFEVGEGVMLESSIDHTRNKLDPDSHWNRPNAGPFRIYSDSLEPRGKGTRTFKLNYGNRTKIDERLFWKAMENKLHMIVGLSLTTTDMMPKTANLDDPLSYDDSFSNQVKDTQKFHNLTETNMGVFVQGQYDFSQQLKLTVGGRYDNHSRYGSTFNPRVVLNYYDEKTGWFAKGIAGTSFLAPAAFFTFDTFLVPRDSQQVPNTDLKPEETKNFELNVGRSFDNIVLEGTIFRTRIDNLIMQRQVKTIEQLTDAQGPYTFTTLHTVNSGETEIDGVSLEAKGKFGANLSPYASYTYIRGETKDTTNNGQPYDLIHSPDHQFKLGLDSKWLDDKLTLYTEAHYTGKAKYHPDNFRLPASDNQGRQFEMASFWVVGLGGKYAINETFNVKLDVTNLFDKSYDQPIVGQETSSWTRIAATPGVPRQYSIGVSARF